VGVVQEDVGDGEGVRELAVADEGHGADDADALLPDCFAIAREVVEEGAVAVEEPFAEERVAGEVDEVPVVDAVGVIQIEFDALLLLDRRLLRVPEDLHEGEQGGEAQLVVLAGDAFFEVVETRLPPAFADDRARHGNLDSQELVALAVLAGAGLEEAREPRHLGGVRVREHLCPEDVHQCSISSERASWSGQLVPRALQSMPRRRAMTSSFFMPTTRAERPWVLPWQPPVYWTRRMMSPSSSMSICCEQTAPQVRKEARRMPPSWISEIGITSNMMQSYGK